MLDPFTVLAASTVASAAISGISNYIAGNKQKKALGEATAAQKAETARIQGLLEKLQDPKFQGEFTDAEIDDLIRFDPAYPKKIVEQAPEAIPLIQAKSPKFLDKITEADPTVAKFISEKMPELIKASSLDAKEARSAQKAALQALRKAGTEEDVLSQSEMMRARESAAAAEAGQRGAITEEMARRGQLGGGQELLMKLSGQQASQQQAAQASALAAENAIRNRLGALSQAGQLGGQIFEQDVNIERSNLDAINAFNTRNTAAMRDIERSRVADINARAAREASAQRQREASNVALENAYRQAETDYERERILRDWQANEAYKQRETSYERQQAADRANILNTAEAERVRAKRDLTMSERARLDDIAQLKYQNELDKVRTQQGIGQQNVQAGFQEAAAKSSQAQGEAQFYGDLARAGAQTAGAYAGMQAGQEENAIDLELKKERLKQLRGY